MSGACSQVKGSNNVLYIRENTNCGELPVKHQVISVLGGAAMAETLSIALDPAYAAGGYSGTTQIKIYPRTKLFFGTTVVEVLQLATLTTTASVVKVRPLLSAVAPNATSQSYLAVRLCTKGVTSDTTPQQVNNSTNCNGNLATNAITSYSKKVMITGFPDALDAGFWLMNQVGEALGSLYYYLDHDGQYGEYGVITVPPPNSANGDFGNLETFTIAGEVQSVKVDAGSIYLSPSEIIAANATRKLFGAQDLKIYS